MKKSKYQIIVICLIILIIIKIIIGNKIPYFDKPINILILGRGNYCKCIMKNYNWKNLVYHTIDTISYKIKYDYVLVTYPTHVLEEKLDILKSFNWDTLVHMQTNTSVLYKYKTL